MATTTDPVTVTGTLHELSKVRTEAGEEFYVHTVSLLDEPLAREVQEFVQAVKAERKLSAKQQAEVEMARGMGVKI